MVYQLLRGYFTQNTSRQERVWRLRQTCEWKIHGCVPIRSLTPMVGKCRGFGSQCLAVASTSPLVAVDIRSLSRVDARSVGHCSAISNNGRRQTRDDIGPSSTPGRISCLHFHHHRPSGVRFDYGYRLCAQRLLGNLIVNEYLL